MGLSCKSKSAIAVCNSTSSNGTFLESFKFRDLETATNWFSRDNLILRTSHGHMYRGTLPDGRVVAVKRPDVSQRSHDEAFDNEVRILSRLFSRRLVNLLGCSRDGRVKLLVLEYMDNGPLHENLTDFSLSWPMRVKLAVDIAKAIRALHASNPPIVHRNLRTTNVFLDRDGSARLGDFGLAKIVPELAEPPRRSNLISIPETGTEEEEGRHSSAGMDDFDVEETPSSETRMINPKTDVYSFGILLLEVMSGRSGCDEARLLDWALPLIKHGHSMAICDSRIMPIPDSVAVRIMANIAARCVRSSSSRRPAMEEVVQCLIKASKLVPEPLWTTTSTSSPMISTPSYPELTPSTTSSRELTSTRRTGSNSMSRRQEKLINSNLDAGHTPFNANSNSSALQWSNGLKKKRTTPVFRLGRFLVRKLRFARRGSSYEKVPVTGAAAGTTTTKTKSKKKWKVSASRRSPLKGAKVSDDLEPRERSIVVELEEGLHSFHKEQELSGEEDLPYHQPPESKKSRVKSRNNSSRFSGYYSSGNHRSGKKFVKL